MEEHKIKYQLSKLYKQITNEYIDWSQINKDKYLTKFIQSTKSNPIFNKLCKKYKLKDILLNEDIIKNKYIYVYIFFDILWEKIKNSSELKNKIFELDFLIKNNDKNNIFANKIFANIKRLTLVYGVKINDFLSNCGFSGKITKDIMFNLGISINILEAVIAELLHFKIINPFIGLYLIISLPFLNKITSDNKRYINKDWLNLYTSWNYNFIYGDGPGKDLFPIAGICLINSQDHLLDDLWISNRLYTLYLTTIITLSFDKVFLLDKKVNSQVLDYWNKENLKYAKKILFQHLKNFKLLKY